MRKAILPLSVSCLLSSFLLFPVVKAGGLDRAHQTSAVRVADAAITTNTEANTAEAKATVLYESLGLESMGLNREAMVYAFKGYQKLLERGALNNSDVLTICDFSQPSNKKRMYIVDVTNGKVLLNTYVAHGKNTGLANAERFSNRVESLQSSLGFYVTKSTYFGKHGLSLKLDGQEKGFNDNAEARAVVVHGADYIGDSRLGAPYMGRSFGCPAVPQQQASTVINYIKNGTALFIYSPNQQYLHGSTILNG